MKDLRQKFNRFCFRHRNKGWHIGTGTRRECKDRQNYNKAVELFHRNIIAY